MNIQTERLEDQQARFTVEIDAERMENAKRQAARRIAKRINIPGFRRGKAPYHILVQNGLEPQIVTDAIENLSQEVYRETIEQADVDPYGPGAFEDYKLEPVPTFIYTVPLRPTVDLKDFKSIRLDYEEPEVTDEQVDFAMRRLREEHALVEESRKTVETGNRVTVDIHSEFADDPPEAAEREDGENDDEDDAPPAKGTHFVHEHDAQLMLYPDEDPILPGFKEALVGAEQDEEREFELTIPEDSDDYIDSIVGRKIHFRVNIKKIEVVTLPELTDDFAARVTQEEQGEEQPLTLLELRMRVRENLEEDVKRQADNAYFSDILDKIVEQAEIAYPQAMVDDQIHDMIHDLENVLRQQKITLDTYMKVTGTTHQDFHERYHESAENTIRRSLVVQEIATQENLKVTDEELEKRIDSVIAGFGEQAQALRSMFDNPTMRVRMANDILQQRITDYVVAMAKGEDPVAAVAAKAEIGATETISPEDSETEADEPDVELPADNEAVEAEVIEDETEE